MLKKDANISKNFSNISVVQLNSIAGNLQENSKKIVNYIKKGTDTIFFSPLTLFGQGMEDVLERHEFLLNESIKWLNVIAEYTIGKSVFVGVVNPKDKKSAVALLKNGKLETIISEPKVVNVDGVSYQFLFNENDNVHQADIYVDYVPIAGGKTVEYDHIEFLKRFSKKYKAAVLHVNPVGVTDSKSFEGKSKLIKNGELLFQAPAFEEGLFKITCKKQTFDIQKECSFSLNYEDDLERIYKVLIQGIKDYFNKCGLKRAVIGLSGGLDSTVSAVLLADALGKENVIGISMPSKLTSEESMSDAALLAKNLDIVFIEYPIKDMYETISKCLSDIFEQVEKNWDCRYKQSYTSDNIQARSRAMYLWGVANEFESCIPIATSDKSEAYMGYATVNGDMSGGYAPILDVTKTKLFALARWMNKHRKEKNSIPQTVIDKKPGAELAIDPKTGKTLNAEDALMPYEFMDEVIWMIENGKEFNLYDTDFLYEQKYKITKEQKKEWLDRFYRRMSFAIFKSSIMPPSVVINYPTNIKTEYYQPITSCRIDYKIKTMEEIRKILSET